MKEDNATTEGIKTESKNNMKKFQIIYADPPWSYRVWAKKTEAKRTASSHYNIMTKQEIQNLPVAEIADKNCALFLWVTFPCLEEGLELIRKWGFTYKTIGFTWIKQNKKTPSLFWGMGYYTRANSEVCLLATKGKMKRIDAGVHSVIMSKIQKHSQKPVEVRDRIVKLFGDLPRIILFSRKQTQGWISLGDNINGRDIHTELLDVIQKQKE